MLKNNDVQKLLLDVFGRRVSAEKRAGQWRLYLPGNEGKRRPFSDFVIPRDIDHAAGADAVSG